MTRTCRLLALAVPLALLSSVAVRAADKAKTSTVATEQSKTAAGTNQALLLQTIRANRKALIAVSLNLNDEESARFWPIYDRYQTEIAATGDRVLALVKDYEAHFTDLSNDKALQLTRDYLEADAQRLKVRLTYLDEFSKVLPGRTVARFYQIENKLDAVMRYDLASTIPVVEEKGAAPAK